jgi:transcriptional regulator with XRE-family HTH domain
MAKKKPKKLDPRVYAIAERLKQLRKDMDYSSYESFAINFDLDRKQYWRIENGSNITISTLIKVLDIHKKDLSVFFREVENMKKSKDE